MSIKKYFLLLLIILLLGMVLFFVVSKEQENIQNQKSAMITSEQMLDDNAKMQNTTNDDGLVLVTRVVDGDTIEIEGGQKIRYIGIDTPETVHPNKVVECFGVEASNYNKSLVDGKRVRLEKDITDIDRYGRLLRYVYVDDVFVNLKMVQDGYAKSYTYPPDVKHQDLFLAANREAMTTNKGLWGSCGDKNIIDVKKDGQKVIVDAKCNIKGNINSVGEKIYHLIGCGSYEQTKIDEVRGEKWFCSEKEALDAGWVKAKNC